MGNLANNSWKEYGKFGSHVKTCIKKTEDSETEQGIWLSRPFGKWLTQKGSGRTRRSPKRQSASGVLFVVNNRTKNLK